MRDVAVLAAADANQFATDCTDPASEAGRIVERTRAARCGGACVKHRIDRAFGTNASTTTRCVPISTS